jgi:hypothetical protein
MTVKADAGSYIQVKYRSFAALSTALAEGRRPALATVAVGWVLS